MKDQLYFIQDSDSELNIKEKLTSIPIQNMKFLQNKSEYPMTEISELSQSLDSDENSSSNYETQKFPATSDYKVVQSVSDSRNINNPRKSVAINNEKAPLSAKYRNSNVISFGKGHFTMTHTEKNNKSIIEEKEENEKNNDEMQNKNTLEIGKEDNFLLKEEEKPEKNNEDVSFDHFSTKSKGIQRTLYNLISNFYLVKKFISILRNATSFRRPKWLNSIHFGMINDWTFYKEGWIDKSQELDENSVDPSLKNFDKMISIYKSIIMKKLIKCSVFNKMMLIFSKINSIIFHPTRLFRAIWDIFQMLIIICYLYIIPINLSFGINVLSFFKEKNPGFTDFFIYFTMIFFLMDVFINMNTAFYNKGELIYDRRKIISFYIKKHFIYDILSILYIFLKVFNANEEYHFPYDNILGFFFILRMRNLNRIATRIEEFILLDDTFFHLITLIKLIFGVLLLSHFFACIWHYISFVNLGDENTWLNVHDLATEIWWKKYIYSYYFVVVVMNTVGFGDIVPQNNTERLYSIFFIFFACGTFAYTINSIGIIVQDINKSNKIFKRNLHLINGYMKQKNITFDLRVRIRKYFEYIWKEERVHNDEETQEIINKLSKSLKDELLFEGNGTILNKLPIFFKNFSQDTLRKLVYEMKEISFTPGDVIYSINEEDDRSLFIVRKGEVELFVETPKFLDPITIIRTVTSGEVFGELSFFSGKERESIARSTTFTSLYLIKEESFLSIIQGNSEDYQTFCEIRDNANLYNEYKQLFIACFSCKGKDHSTLNCPLLHLTLSKQRILQRFNYSQPQNRLSFVRLRKRTSNPLKNFRKNEAAVYKLLNLLVDDDTEESDEEVSSEELLNLETSKNEKRELPRLVSEITEDDNLSVKEIISHRINSPKFNETDSKSNILRLYSKKSLKGGYFNYDQSSNEISSSMFSKGEKSKIDKKKYQRAPIRKHLTQATDYQRQISKDENASKYSVNSKKSSRSKVSYSRNLDISRLNSKREIQQKVGNLQELGRNKPQESNISIPRYKGTEDSFIKDLSILLKKERHKKILFTESSIPSKDSKPKSSTSTTIDKTIRNEENYYEKIMKTMTEGENSMVYDYLKSFEFYFPHNNIENIVVGMDEAYEKKFKKKKISKFEKMNTKKNNEIANLISNYSKNWRKMRFVKREESEKHIEMDKEKMIKILKEQERKSMIKQGYVNRFLYFLNLKKEKKSPIMYARKKSIWKK